MFLACTIDPPPELMVTRRAVGLLGQAFWSPRAIESVLNKVQCTVFDRCYR